MKRYFSILLSVVLLVSHMSLTIGTHICQGKAIETKLIYGDTHLGCGMEDTGESCEIPSLRYVSFSKEQCCENQYQLIQSSDEFVKDTFQFNLSIDFATAFVYSVLNIVLTQHAARQLNATYIPPPLEKNVPALFQTFLI